MVYRRANGLDEFYSRSGRHELVELFLDRQGNPTLNYPHVHVIHHGDHRTEVLASLSSEFHTGKKVLTNPSGQEVAAAILRARSLLNTVAYPINMHDLQIGFVRFVMYRDGWVCSEIILNGRSLTTFSYRPKGSKTSMTLERGQTFSSLPPGGTYTTS